MSGQTPLYDMLAASARRDTARFHMPGHKALPLPGGVWRDITALDVTELSYSGNLYTETEGPIRDAEHLLASLYGTPRALFLTGGATQGVLSMLAAVTSPGDAVLVHRNAHRSVFHALALLDLDPHYCASETVLPFGAGDGLDPSQWDAALAQTPGIRAAVVTSPSYYGVLSDIPALSAVCRRHKIPLLIDAAHGAHLPFTGTDKRPPSAQIPADGNPVAQGADIAVFSAHKTLPALGQSAFLLASSSVDCDRLRYFTSVFGTSSPSYPLMASMDLARAELSEKGFAAWARAADFGRSLRKKYPHVLSGDHLRYGTSDPCRICLCTGDGYADALMWEREYGILCEMADSVNIVLIVTAADSPAWHTRLENAIARLPRRAFPDIPPLPNAEKVLSPRQAMFSPSEALPLGQCAERIAGVPLAPYPPGVPLVAPGERIDKIHIEILTNLCYTIDEDIRVVK